MKAFKLITFIAFISLLGACAQKGKAPVDIKLNVGAAFSGVPANGGIILYGSNGTDEFQLGLADPNQNLTLDLSFGTWRFLAISWEGPGQKFTGAQRCEDFTVDIAGANAAVSLMLTQLKCASPIFASAAMKLAGQFRPVDIYSCLSLSNITTFSDTCDMNVNNTGRTLGFSNSIRVVFEGWSSFGAPMPELSTTCISKNTIMDSKFNQQLNLPLEGDIPFLIVGYEDLNCTKPSETYDYDSGLGNLISIDKSLAKNATTYNSLYLADNFVGAYSTALIDQIPYFKCGATNDQSCMPINTYQKFDGAYNNYDMVHDFLTTAFGSSDGKSQHRMGRPAFAIHTGSSYSIIFYRSVATSSENGIFTVNFTNTDIAAGAVPTWNGADTLTIDVDDVATGITTLGTIVTNVNSMTGTTGIIAEIKTGTPAMTIDSAAYASVSLTLSNGEDPQLQDRRELGLIHETQRIFGVYGAILYRAGYPTCASLSPGVAVSFVHDFDTISIQISNPTLTEPTGYGSGSAYEKRMSVYENGVLVAEAEFNCSANQKSGYAYIYHLNNDATNETIVDMFWDTTTAAAAKAEFVLYQEHTDLNGDIAMSKMLMKLSKTGVNTYESWLSYAWEQYDYLLSPIGTPAYMRYSLAANSSTDKLITRQFSGLLSNDGTSGFATGGTMEEWFISSRASTTGTGLATTAVSPTLPAMNSLNGDYIDYSIDELLYSLGSITP